MEAMLTLNGMPAVCVFGIPVFPVADPGFAVSPGKIICSLGLLTESAFTFTGDDRLMLNCVPLAAPELVSTQPVLVAVRKMIRVLSVKTPFEVFAPTINGFSPRPTTLGSLACT